MRVTLLGHASVLVEMEGACCLMDPVFGDPFEEGIVIPCPRREVFPAKLPAVDTLIVSHRHPDHFDIPSLAQVDRDCDAICPAGPLIVYALKALGFERVHPVYPMGPILSQDFELYPTRSEIRSIPECGMVFKDRTGVFWNQVDTSLSPETIAAIRARFGTLDLLFAMYASQNFDFFETRSTEFPFETHRENLDNVLRIHPRVAVPSSAGFRFCEPHEWLNAFLFPISRERFVADLEQLEPGIHTCLLNPGDIVEVSNGKAKVHSGASEAARTIEQDTARIDFDPTAAVPELVDPNPEGYPDEHLSRVVGRLIRQDMASYCQGGDDRALSLYRQHHARYAVAVVFPNGRVNSTCFAFEPDTVEVSSDPAACQAADVVHRIAASALVGWIERKKSFFYVRAYSRRFNTLYQLSHDSERVELKPRPLPDLLMHYVLNCSEGSELFAKQQVELQLAALKA